MHCQHWEAHFSPERSGTGPYDMMRAVCTTQLRLGLGYGNAPDGSSRIVKYLIIFVVV